MVEYRRILLDGSCVQVRRDGDELVGRGRPAGGRGRRRAPASRGAQQDRGRPSQPPQPGHRVWRHAAPGPDLLPQAHLGARRPRRRRGQAGGLPVPQLRGRGRDRDRAHLPRRATVAGRRLHRRVHHRQRLRAARLPRHRRRVDAARQGLGHDGPARPGPGHRLGLPRQTAAHLRQRRGSRRTGPPTRCSGTCTTWSPTSRARSRSAPATCCCRERRPTPGRSSPATWSRSRWTACGRLANHIVAGPAAVPADFGAQPTASEEVISTALGGDWEFRGIRPPIRA